MDIKKLFINFMVVICVIVVIFSVATAIKRSNEPEDTEITYDLIENSEIIYGTEYDEDTETEEDTQTEEPVDVEIEPKFMYATSKVNVRTGPATTYDSLGEITRGTKVSAVGEVDENGWQKIIYEDQEAYILATYLSEEEPAQTSQSSNRPSSNTGNNTSNSNSNSNSSNTNQWGLIDPYGGQTPVGGGAASTPSGGGEDNSNGGGQETTDPAPTPTPTPSGPEAINPD